MHKKKRTQTNARTSKGEEEEEIVLPDLNELMEMYADIELRTYPNPFNTSITIDYVPETSTTLNVSIFDLSGKEIETLYKGEVAAFQPFSWRFEPTGDQKSNIYLLHIDEGKNKEVRKLVRVD